MHFSDCIFWKCPYCTERITLFVSLGRLWNASRPIMECQGCFLGYKLILSNFCFLDYGRKTLFLRARASFLKNILKFWYLRREMIPKLCGCGTFAPPLLWRSSFVFKLQSYVLFDGKNFSPANQLFIITDFVKQTQVLSGFEPFGQLCIIVPRGLKWILKFQIPPGGFFSQLSYRKIICRLAIFVQIWWNCFVWFHSVSTFNIIGRLTYLLTSNILIFELSRLNINSNIPKNCLMSKENSIKYLALNVKLLVIFIWQLKFKLKCSLFFWQLEFRIQR